MSVTRFTTEAYTKPDARAIARAAEHLLRLAHADAGEHPVRLDP